MNPLAENLLTSVSQSGFNVATLTALGSMVAVVAATAVLFVFTMGSRLFTNRRSRRQRRVTSRWRLVLSRVALSANAANRLRLSGLRRAYRLRFLEEWNRIRGSVTGTAADNLVQLALRAGLREYADSLFRKRNLRFRILAVQTLGYLRQVEYLDAIRELVDHRNSALSVTAAAALVEIDAPYAISVLLPIIPKRRDWSKPRVWRMLVAAGSDCISEPMFRTIRAAEDDDKAYLLRFTDMLDAEVLDALTESLIRENDHPGVLKEALNRISGFNGIPRIAQLTRHEDWFIRVSAAKALGRMATEEHVPLLEKLMADREWWVRYRAAQAIVRLPNLGPESLRQMQRRQNDRYASDILTQARAEAGLA